jgi:hypothetical protein
MTLPDAVAYYAILALALACGSATIAVWLLTIFCKVTGLQLPANCRNFILTWRGRMNPDGTLDRHAHNSGAYQQLTDQMAEEAYQGIIGWREANRRNPYRNRREIETQCPAAKKVLRESGVTVRTLIERIQRLHPNFKFKILRIRFELTPHHKAVRRSVCQRLRQHFTHLLHCMVFVDQKLINVWEEEVTGWVDTSVPNYAVGIRPAYYKGKVIKLKYYAAVHMTLGAFFIRFYTGTSGMDNNHDGNNYMVSSGYKQLWCAPSLHMRHSTLQLLSPQGSLSITTGDRLIHPQPQHTPTLPHGFLSIQPVPLLSFSKATLSAVGLCHWSSTVPLALHFNQQAARQCNSNVPPF